MDLTIAICAYNAASRIGMVLDSLSRQECDGITWELLIVDNASSDKTTEMCEEWFNRISAPCNIVREPTPGLSHARRRAALEAKGKWISFLDDDTIARPNWIVMCVDFLSRHPKAGIVGGRILPRFENPEDVPPNVWKTHGGLLSLYDKGEIERQVDGKIMGLPVGAGMSGPRECFVEAFDRVGSLTVGRTGTSLKGGEDFEAMWLLMRRGWEVWYCPSMILDHWVPAHKLKPEYMERWLVDSAQCLAWLRILSNQERLTITDVGRCLMYFEWQAIRQLILAPISAPKHKSRKYWARLNHSQAKGYWAIIGSYRRAAAILANNSQGIFDSMTDIKPART